MNWWEPTSSLCFFNVYSLRLINLQNKLAKVEKNFAFHTWRGYTLTSWPNKAFTTFGTWILRLNTIKTCGVVNKYWFSITHNISSLEGKDNSIILPPDRVSLNELNLWSWADRELMGWFRGEHNQKPLLLSHLMSLSSTSNTKLGSKERSIWFPKTLLLLKSWELLYSFNPLWHEHLFFLIL